MHAETPLIATIVAGLVLAFVFGAAAQRLRLPPLVGYLIAGVAVGPFTPGFVADQSLAPELAEIGVILLMFGVGLHFSLKDLLSVRAIAIPGAMVQIAVATALGVALALALGWSVGAGLVFGLALSVASTVVLLKALQDRRLIDTGQGRIAVGWLIVEDLVCVLALVLIPAAAPLLGGVVDSHAAAAPGGLPGAVALTLAKVAGFVALMLIVGRKVIPWVLHYVAHTGSRELFRLAVLAIALGAAFGAAQLFGVSFALGAFFAGMILSESELSQRAAEETLPLRDAFAVLFFVAVGMLFNPAVLLESPWAVLAVVLIVVIGKSAAAFAIVRVFKHPTQTALTISASLAQIGEFSFILAALGVTLEILPPQGRDLILAGAILSILLNPLVFALAERLVRRGARRAEADAAAAVAEASDGVQDAPTALSDHVVVVGAGRVGRHVAETLAEQGLPVLVLEMSAGRAADLAARGVEVHVGNAARPGGLDAAALDRARRLVVCVPDAFEGGRIVEHARRLAPDLPIVARAHFDAEARHLQAMGATRIVIGQVEIARGLVAALDGAA
ncbi:MAG TPA: YbaL family putative K(+) efflux transporter [Caulobacteraceae bacterium]